MRLWLLALLLPVAALAQGVPNTAIVVPTCGTVPSPYVAGQNRSQTMDTTGRNCDNILTIPSNTPQPVQIQPGSGSGIAIPPIVSVSAESSHVLKASGGNLYSAYVTTGATSGLLMIFDATSLPGNGAVTPKHCLSAPANGTVGLTFQPGPVEPYSTGIVLGFSSGTNCFSLAASATAFFHGAAQ